MLPPRMRRWRRAKRSTPIRSAPCAIRSATRATRRGRSTASAAKLKADEIREWIIDAKGMTAKTKATRKPEMKAYTLPKDDVDALVAYLATLKK